METSNGLPGSGVFSLDDVLCLFLARFDRVGHNFVQLS